jgi:hypothetical protein
VTFVPAAVFSAGDRVIFRTYVRDSSTGLGVENATVDIEVTGPETVNLAATRK